MVPRHFWPVPQPARKPRQRGTLEGTTGTKTKRDIGGYNWYKDETIRWERSGTWVKLIYTVSVLFVTKVLVILCQRACHSLKIVELRFRERLWCALDAIVYFFVVVCQSGSCVCQVFCYRDWYVEACGLLEPYWWCGGVVGVSILVIRLTILSIWCWHHTSSQVTSCNIYSHIILWSTKALIRRPGFLCLARVAYSRQRREIGGYRYCIDGTLEGAGTLHSGTK